MPREFAGAEGLLLGTAAASFLLFWVQMSLGVGGRIQHLLRYDNGTLEGGATALYPSVRTASLGMVTELYNVMQMGLLPSDASDAGLSLSMGAGGGGTGGGVIGGLTGLEDAVFLSLGMVAPADRGSRADQAPLRPQRVPAAQAPVAVPA